MTRLSVALAFPSRFIQLKCLVFFFSLFVALVVGKQKNKIKSVEIEKKKKEYEGDRKISLTRENALG